MILYCALRGCSNLVTERSKTQLETTALMFCSRGHYRDYLGSREAVCERFWRRVIICGDDDCWLWTGPTNGTYGSFGFTIKGRRINISSHRFSWIYYYGKIVDGLQVCHNCPDGDNPLCVNINHLWLGTQYDNMQDKVRKCRQPYGSDASLSKLSDDDVQELIRLRTLGWTYIQLSIAFNISASQIGHILTGKSWKHVIETRFIDNSAIHRNNRKMSQCGILSRNAKLSEDEVITMIRLRSDGCTYQRIAELFNISTSHVGSIIRGDRWSHIQKREKEQVA